jgi:hypothetical protein
MPMASLDNAIAGMQQPRYFAKGVSSVPVIGRPHSTWLLQGIPSAGGNNTSLAGVHLSSSGGMVVGQLPFKDAVGGANYLARFVADCSQPGKILLCDRLWSNGGFTSVTSIQMVGNTPWYPRDNNGQSDGEGVYLALEYNFTAAGNTPTVSATYTNSAGVGGRVASTLIPITANATAQGFYPMSLANGDVGVKDVTFVTFSLAPTAGGCNLVAYRVLASLEIPGPYQASAIDLVTGGMAKMWNGTVPFLVFVPATASGFYLSGTLTTTQG